MAWERRYFYTHKPVVMTPTMSGWKCDRVSSSVAVRQAVESTLEVHGSHDHNAGIQDLVTTERNRGSPDQGDPAHNNRPLASRKFWNTSISGGSHEGTSDSLGHRCRHLRTFPHHRERARVQTRSRLTLHPRRIPDPVELTGAARSVQHRHSERAAECPQQFPPDEFRHVRSAFLG